MRNGNFDHPTKESADVPTNTCEQAAVPLTPAQEAELDRRLEAHRQSPQEGASWEEVKARIQVKP
jgi:hypothetical protein